MPINSLIPMSIAPINISDAALQGQQARRDRQFDNRQAQAQDMQLRQAQEAEQAQRAQAQAQAKAVSEFASIYDGVRKLRPLLPKTAEELPRFQQAVAERAAEIEARGGDASETRFVEQLAANGDIARIDELFQNVENTQRQLQAGQLGVEALLPKQQTQSKPTQFGQPVPVRLDDGTFALQGGVLGADGIPTMQSVALTGQPVSRLGETGSQTSERETGQAVNTRAGQQRVTRLSDDVEKGQSAADGLGSINRGLEILNQIGTGRPQAVALEAKRLFGVESGDEGELSNLLGKAVLSQLRETFGAQFTANEGEQLAKIEANFGKNNATNMRLLNNAKAIANRAARRGLEAAIQLQDKFAEQQIREAMNFTLSEPPPEDESNKVEFDDGTTVVFE